MPSVALTIAGSDPSGGAGIQADLKVFHQNGVFGTSVLTLLTVQNTQHVSAVHALPPDFVLAQLDAVVSDIPPLIAKTGALGTAETIDALAARLPDYGFPVIVDPVMISKHGDPLLDPDAAGVLRGRLAPRALLVTPNMHEAAALTEREVLTVADMERAAATIGLLGAPNVLVTGGQLEGQCVDVLWAEGELHRFSAARIDTPHTHGSGCAFSAAITAQLARGESLANAVHAAKQFVTRAIRNAPGLGSGCGPTDLFAKQANKD